MNIFDMYQQMQGQRQQDPFAMGQSSGLDMGTGGGLGGYTPPQQDPQVGPGPVMPQAPHAGQTGGDVSGFANSGMTPPALPDPGSAIRGLMSMAGDPHAQSKIDPMQQQQEGGIMAYLRSLGV